MEDKLEREEGIHKVIEYSHADSRLDMDSFSNLKNPRKNQESCIVSDFLKRIPTEINHQPKRKKSKWNISGT